VATHKQAKKRNRQRIKRRARNLTSMGAMRTAIKRVRRALAADDVKTAQEKLPVALRAIAKACSKGTIHRNTASRNVSRLTRAVNTASQ
jgi:small subunit ribosomal protein S20